jgi:hypothetical protein
LKIQVRLDEFSSHFCGPGEVDWLVDFDLAVHHSLGRRFGLPVMAYILWSVPTVQHLKKQTMGEGVRVLATGPTLGTAASFSPVTLIHVFVTL